MATRREGVGRAKEATARGGDASGPFTLDEVKALVKVLEGTDVTSLRWDRNGQQLVIKRGQAGGPQPVASLVPHAVVHHAPPPVAVAPPAATPQPASAAPAAAAAEQKPGVVVTSPFVGTFYRSPSPESPPFVEVGTVVKKGQVLCIVEAMKLMNEIEAEAPGKVAEILAVNGSPVEFGQALFRIEPA
jgi:acetyl-CoA carboxylase biotin carboxyl carrier protein